MGAEDLEEARLTMGSKSGKYWDESCNPIKTKRGGYHCTKCSPGCANCWAEQMNRRTCGRLHIPFAPYDDSAVEFVLDEKVLWKVSHWKKPRTIFVCDLCDIGHPDIPNSFLREILFHSWYAKQHTYLLLTKRPERFAGKGSCSNCGYLAPIKGECDKCGVTEKYMVEQGFGDFPRKFNDNIWLGVTVCNQAEADEKIPILLQIPAAHRWVSIEPLLGEIDLARIGDDRFGWGRIDALLGLHYIRANALEEGSEWETRNVNKLDWLVIGCESLGRRAGRFQDGFIDAALKLVRQGKEAGVPVYVKQIPINGKVSKDPSKWPEELRKREKRK